LADVLLVTDGDADRLGIGDETWHFRQSNCKYSVYWLTISWKYAKERGAIVKTLSTTSMLDKLGKLYDVPVYETGVGFKYVAPKMLETERAHRR